MQMNIPAAESCQSLLLTFPLCSRTADPPSIRKTPYEIVHHSVGASRLAASSYNTELLLECYRLDWQHLALSYHS